MESIAAHVLLVDDDASVLEVVSSMLADQGYVCRTAGDGGEAWAQLQSGLRPRVVVTDVHMPELTGVQLARRMSEHPELRFVPVVFASGSSANMATANEWLMKPYRIEDLLWFVEKYRQRGLALPGEAPCRAPEHPTR
jgi:CheY-like chemotaxis protein